MDRNSPIGVFDSGVGGLTVAREIMRQMPEERIIYFGDTARLPYGSKSQDTVLRYSRQIIRFLMTKEVKAIVIACNTASAYVLEAVERELDIPIIGVIRAGARTAVHSTRNGKIGVIGTEGTISSGIYTDVMRQMRPDIEVSVKACPLFVPLVEEGRCRPGDVVIYDFPGGAPTDHTGVIERILPVGVVAIEGNTSQAGSQSNGGMVCRKTRPYSQIVGVVRPNYKQEDKRMDNTPSPAHKEGVEWARKNGILTGDASGDLKLTEPVTRQQLCTMLYRFAKKIGKI